VKKWTLFLLILCLQAVCSADGIEPEDLVKGGYTLYFRHTHADVGEDCKDPSKEDWWRSTSSELTRQLAPRGRRQAAVIGQAFRTLDIPVGTFLSSEFRRSHETAELLNVGAPKTARELTPIVYGEEEPPGLRELLQRLPERGTNTVLVAHGHLLPEFFDLQEGAAVVFQPGHSAPLGTITYEQWAKAAGPLLFESQVEDDEYRLDGATLTITSTKGIGSVLISPTDERWPSLDSLTLHYPSGERFERLEGLSLTSGEFRYSLPRTLTGDSVRIPIPPKFLQTGEPLKIRWVDVYR